MVQINSTLKNYSVLDIKTEMFSSLKGYEITTKNVIRQIKKPICTCCSTKTNRNGWDLVTKKNILSLKIGRFRCPNCGTEIKKDTSFFSELIDSLYETVNNFLFRLSDRDVSYQVMSDLMELVIPSSKDTLFRKIKSSIEKLVIKEHLPDVQVVHYDEQHPKKGRFQRYRLTLIDAISNKVIAEKLCKSKDSLTVEEFFRKNLDTNKETIVITDGDTSYPEIIKTVFGKNGKHQMCLLHLNKLICNDIGKFPSLQELYNQYLFLNIFFNREQELDFIQNLISEQKNSSEKSYVKKARKEFYSFVRTLEKERRRSQEGLTIRPLEEALNKFETLKIEKLLFSKNLQKRLDYIQFNWSKFTLFYDCGCPHTNNVIENYFSASLKTHRKKQFRTTQGLLNKMKLSRYKRNEGFSKPKFSFLDIGRILWALSI